MVHSKRLFIAAGVFALVFGLTSCSQATPEPGVSGSPSAGASAPSEAKKVDSIDHIKVSENFGEAPEVTEANYPFKVDETMSRVIVEGSGREIPDETANVELNYVGIDARSGETFDSSFQRGSSVVFPLGGVVKGFSKGLVGKTEGSRVLIAITSADGYPQGNPQAGIEAGDTLLFVVDVIRTQYDGPQGEAKAAPAGMPKVSEKDGKPVIDIAGAKEPSEVKTAVLVAGSGRALGESDALTSHAMCVSWAGQEYYSDFGKKPATDAKASQSPPLAPLFDALVGQHEGSRVLVTLPGATAYPHGNPNPSLAPNTAVACVVDILFTQSVA